MLSTNYTAVHPKYYKKFLRKFLADQQIHQLKPKILNNLNFNPESAQCKM